MFRISGILLDKLGELKIFNLHFAYLLIQHYILGFATYLQ